MEKVILTDFYLLFFFVFCLFLWKQFHNGHYFMVNQYLIETNLGIFT